MLGRQPVPENREHPSSSSFISRNGHNRNANHLRHSDGAWHAGSLNERSPSKSTKQLKLSLIQTEVDSAKNHHTPISVTETNPIKSPVDKVTSGHPTTPAKSFTFSPGRTQVPSVDPSSNITYDVFKTIPPSLIPSKFHLLFSSPIFPDRRGEQTYQLQEIFGSTSFSSITSIFSSPSSPSAHSPSASSAARHSHNVSIDKKGKVKTQTVVFPAEKPDPSNRKAVLQLEACINHMLKEKETMLNKARADLDAQITPPGSSTKVSFEGMSVLPHEYMANTRKSIREYGLPEDTNCPPSPENHTFPILAAEFEVYAIAIHEIARQIWGHSQQRAVLLERLNYRCVTLFNILKEVHSEELERMSDGLGRESSKRFRLQQYKGYQEVVKYEEKVDALEAKIKNLRAEHKAEREEWKKIRASLEAEHGKYQENQHLKKLQSQLEKQVKILRAQCDAQAKLQSSEHEEVRVWHDKVAVLTDANSALQAENQNLKAELEKMKKQHQEEILRIQLLASEEAPLATASANDNRSSGAPAPPVNAPGAIPVPSKGLPPARGGIPGFENLQGDEQSDDEDDDSGSRSGSDSSMPSDSSDEDRRSGSSSSGHKSPKAQAALAGALQPGGHRGLSPAGPRGLSPADSRSISPAGSILQSAARGLNPGRQGQPPSLSRPVSLKLVSPFDDMSHLSGSSNTPLESVVYKDWTEYIDEHPCRFLQIVRTGTSDESLPTYKVHDVGASSKKASNKLGKKINRRTPAGANGSTPSQLVPKEVSLMPNRDTINMVWQIILYKTEWDVLHDYDEEERQGFPEYVFQFLLLRSPAASSIAKAQDLAFSLHMSVFGLRETPICLFFLRCIDEQYDLDTVNCCLQTINIIRMSTIGIEYRETESISDHTNRQLCTLRTSWANRIIFQQFGLKYVKELDKKVDQTAKKLETNELNLRLRSLGFSLEGWTDGNSHTFRRIDFGQYLNLVGVFYQKYQRNHLKHVDKLFETGRHTDFSSFQTRVQRVDSSLDSRYLEFLYTECAKLAIKEGVKSINYKHFKQKTTQMRAFERDFSKSSKYTYDNHLDYDNERAEVINHLSSCFASMKPSLTRVVKLLKSEKRLISNTFADRASAQIEDLTQYFASTESKGVGISCRYVVKTLRRLLWDWYKFLSFREEMGLTVPAQYSLSSVPSLHVCDEAEAMIFILQGKLQDFVKEEVNAHNAEVLNLKSLNTKSQLDDV